MSWYSDREPFDEHDMPWCRYCEGGESKKQCDECTRRHIKAMEGESDE